MLLPWRFHETLLKDLRYMLYKSLKNCQFSFTPCRDRSRDSSLGKLKAWISFQKLANKILVSLPKTICIQFADIFHEKSCNMGLETPVIPVFCKFQIFCLCIHNFYFSHSWCFRCFYYIMTTKHMNGFYRIQEKSISITSISIFSLKWFQDTKVTDFMEKNE